MLDYLKRLLGFSKPAPAVEAPYKVESPAYEPKKCGCGRSETGFCSGLHAVSDADWATHEKNPNKTKAAPAKKAKAPAKAKAAKAPAKAPTKSKAKKKSA